VTDGDDAKPGSESTGALLERVRHGSQAAMDELFARLRRSLRRWSGRLLPRRHTTHRTTSDVVQDVVSRALPRFQGFEPRHRDALRQYLRTAVRDRIRDELRYLARRPSIEPRAGGAPVPEDEAAVERLLEKERDEKLNRAVATLPNRVQELLVARFRLQLSFQQIALAVGMSSADAARAAVGRAVIRLAQAMERV
jgi:RNA polymerase sigma factor (sigma-70 family)